MTVDHKRYKPAKNELNYSIIVSWELNRLSSPWHTIFPLHTDIAVPQKRQCFIENGENQCVCPFLCSPIIQPTTLGILTDGWLDGRTDGRSDALIPPLFYQILPPLRQLPCYCKGYRYGKRNTDHLLPLGNWFLFIIDIKPAGTLGWQFSRRELDVRGQSYKEKLRNAAQ